VASGLTVPVEPLSSGSEPSSGDQWVAQAQERIRTAVVSRSTLNIEGAGTRRDFGGPGQGKVLSCAGYSGILAYDPGDLVVTVRAGTPLQELDAELSRHGQMLGFEPPQRPGSTVGGAVALGWAGPRQPFAGAVRDHLLGIRLLDGRARDLRFGGQVVKNVAGFDVARLMGGSHGILGLILEVSLRVVPRPAVERTTVIEADSPERALQTTRRLALGPGLLSAASWIDRRLYLRSSGSPACVEEFLARQGGSVMAEQESREFWRGFANQTHRFFDPMPGLRLWRVSVRPDAPPAWPQYPCALDWAGALRWVWAPPAAGAEIAAWARAHGGHAMPVERAEGISAALPPSLLRIHHALADVFDPHRVFNRSRLLGSNQRVS
jgi:glycolate oxidase FAD binding subunit